MKIHALFTVFLLLITSISPAYAENYELILHPYYAASCQDYTGTWEGLLTDPSGLFDDGGPWNMTFQLYNHNGAIIGKTNELKMISNRTEFWAHCQNGILSNIYWGEKGSCGSFSQQGFLISKNMLVLQLHYENAMADATLITILKRKNNTYSLPLPKNAQDYILEKIETCH